MNLEKVFRVLGNQTRLNILVWLKEPAKHFTSSHCDVAVDGVCVGLIEKKTGLSQSTISHYLKMMADLDLITMCRHGQWTLCKRNNEAIEQLVKTIEVDL